jgi:hypothetical protein
MLILHTDQKLYELWLSNAEQYLQTTDRNETFILS